MLLIHSISLHIVALPYNKTVSTQLILSETLEKGAEKDESAVEKDSPISAYFIAAESLAPSPVIATLRPLFYRTLIINDFYSGVILFFVQLLN